jgi:hypothetical protein
MGDLYGWFDSPDPNAPPVYDPPHGAACPYCGLPMTDDDVRTHSMIAAQDATRSYFYRTHRTCDKQASPGQQQSIFSAVLSAIEADGLPIV